MKRILALFGSLSLITSSSILVTSCSVAKAIDEGIYDENWKKVKFDDWDSQQLDDILTVNWSMVFLSKNIVADSESFYQMNGKTSDELAKVYFRSAAEKKQMNTKFHYDFVFLITNYESINRDVIEKMKIQDLQDKKPGTYLFLNLPLNKRKNDLQKETRIIFEFIFMIKTDSGKIIGNQQNNWFYWYQQDNINQLHPNNDQLFFFDLFIYVAHLRVVTSVLF